MLTLEEVAQKNADLEYQAELKSLSAKSTRQAEVIAEAWSQMRLFNQHRFEIYSKYLGKIVGFRANRMFVGDSLREVVEQMKSYAPYAKGYIEEV